MSIAAPADPLTTVVAAPPPRFATAADWWDAIGNVPLSRVRFDPPPGTATEADVLRWADGDDKHLCELVDGTLVEKTMGFEESLIAAQMIFLLKAHVVPRRLGLVCSSDGTMRVVPEQIRIPDTAFISYDRLPQGQRTGRPVPRISPDLAVEILSESNTRREMSLKLADYFAGGTRLVWYVDPPTRTVAVYTSPEAVTRLTEADTLDGGAVLPGFSVPVAAVFDVG